MGARAGSELLFLGAPRSITSVDVHIGDTISAGTPKPRFPLQAGAVFTNVRYDFDVTRQRFLVPRIQAESVADTPTTVVLTWWTEFVSRKADPHFRRVINPIQQICCLLARNPRL